MEEKERRESKSVKAKRERDRGRASSDKLCFFYFLDGGEVWTGFSNGRED